MRVISLKKRLWIFTLVIALGLLIISFFIVIPVANKILNLKSDVESIQRQLEERYEKTQKLKKSVTQLNQVKKATEAFAGSTVNPGDQIKLITEIEKLAVDNQIEQNFNLDFISPGLENSAVLADNEPHAFPQYYKFSFLNNGTWQNQFNYLKAMENLPYYIVINNLKFEKRNSDNFASSTITLNFVGLVYANP